MRTLGLAIAAGALLAASNAYAGSFPVNSMGAGGSDLVERRRRPRLCARRPPLLFLF